MASKSLPERAVHLFFLQQLAKEKVPSKGTGCLGDIKTFEVVKELVKPATASTKVNFIDCLCQGNLGKYQPSWCQGGVLTSLPDSPPAVGPTTYFASHAWSYTFSGLVSLLERHYAGLPETDNGKAYVPIFYWVDILAVTQHFTGDFKDHPDSDFPGVIRASKAVLFTMYPWRAPTAPTRVWCLFEALTAVQSDGVELEVVLDTQGSKDLGQETIMNVAASIDVRSSQATVVSDKTYIMGCIRDGVGVEAFNTTLRKTLKAALLANAYRKATRARNCDALVPLLQMGAARGPDNVLDVPRVMPYGEASQVIDLLGGLTPAAMPRKVVLAGRKAGQDHAVKHGEMMGMYYVKYGRPIYTYLPLPTNLVSAVARLLGGPSSAAQGKDGAAGGGRTGGASSSGASSSSGRRAVASPARGARPNGSNASPSRRGSRTAAGKPGAAGAAGAGPGGAARAGAGPKELWLRPGELQRELPDLRDRWRPNWATAQYMPGFQDEDWMLQVRQRSEPREAETRAQELEAHLAARAELWLAVGASASLTVLGLYDGWLAPGDVSALGQALAQSRPLKELHLVCMRPDKTYSGGAAALARDLLSAALGSRLLEVLVIAPPKMTYLEGLAVPAAAAWDLGGGAALRELTLAPVALGPRTAKQLADLLGPLAALQDGAVDARRAQPRTVLPGSDWAAPHTAEKALRESEDVPKQDEGNPATSLAPLLKLLARSGPTAAPRAAALAHFIGMLTGPAAVAGLGRGVAQEAGVQEAVAAAAAEHRELLQASLQAAPAEYAREWRQLLPSSLA